MKQKVLEELRAVLTNNRIIAREEIEKLKHAKDTPAYYDAITHIINQRDFYNDEIQCAISRITNSQKY